MNTIDDRLYAAVAMAKAGQKQQAREILADILKTERDNASAWLVMAQLVDDRREVIQCLKQVLRIDPTNVRAAAYLKRLDPSVKASARVASAEAARARQAKRRRGSALPILIGLVLVALIAGAGLAAATGFGLFRQSGGFMVGLNPIPDALAVTPTDLITTTTQPVTPTAETFTPTVTFTSTNTSTPTNTATATITVTPRPSATIRPTRTIRPTNTPAPANATSTPTLQASVTLPTSAVGATQPISDMTVIYDTEYYGFEAADADEIREALQTLGPDVTDGTHAIASTKYEFRLEWREIQQGGTCTLDSPTIELSILYTYPQWIPVGFADQVLVDQWDEFIAYVTEHEEHHAEIAIGCGRDLLAALNTVAPANTCVGVNSSVNQIYRNIEEDCKETQEAFDDAEGFTTFPLP